MEAMVYIYVHGRYPTQFNDWLRYNIKCQLKIYVDAQFWKYGET